MKRFIAVPPHRSGWLRQSTMVCSRVVATARRPPLPRTDWVGRPAARGNGTYETPEYSNALLTDADLNWQVPPALCATLRKKRQRSVA